MPLSLTPAVDSLLSASAVRERSHEIFAAGQAGALAHFTLDLDKLDAAASLVTHVIKTNYPALDVPLHARWRHFKFGQQDLWTAIDAQATWRDRAARARAAFDLAIVSVLLDAGAGSDWRYRDAVTVLLIGRSEGLALASLRMFEAGVFSSRSDDPLRADASRLAALSADDLAKGFQATSDNPLAGLEGRAALIAALGAAARAKPDVFARHDEPRPGGLFDEIAAQATSGSVKAPDILRSVLLHLGPIWPGRIALDGISLGDTWRHPAIKRDDETSGLVPFHKLSQWLTYSLVEPLQDAGIAVTDLDGLTGLAEYRNGGLFVDAGVLNLRDPDDASRPHEPGSQLVVEWRALTIALLDLIARPVRQELGVDAARFPLGCVLEGGTWAAGRRLASDKRGDGRPPIHVISDGTVF